MIYFPGGKEHFQHIEDEEKYRYGEVTIYTELSFQIIHAVLLI
jgi:hypothetical protein